MPTAIVVDRLSKEYRLGRLEHETMLREVIVNAFKQPLRRVKRPKDTIWALKNVSFEVEEGEVVGIIGRNGAGKSTLLKLLSRITYPTSGRIRVRGKVSSLLEVGTGFHEELTGRENIYLNGSILGMKKREIQAKLDQIVAFAGVERFVDTPVKRYSTGMTLRLAFAVAAHLEPNVLFVDEVLAVGDADFQKKCLKAMDDLRSGGRTVLFVSHNMSAIENLCPRAIWIEGGEIRKDGESKDVIRSYLSMFADSQRSGHDLRSIESRGGNGEVRYTGIDFLDEEGRPSSLVRSGESVRIRLHFEAREEIHQPHFGVMVYSDMGTLVTTFSTWATGLEVPFLAPGEGKIDLRIDHLNLMPARYYLTLWLSSLGGTKYDHLDHCVALDVETADPYGTGKGIGRRFGIMYVTGEWTYDGKDS
ncbi:MAG: transporter related protein [Candidatus Krumholzibacteriota bacterium]|nr:transporter related protein [Candidatus Krumholzibacteriota bacterium]